MSTNKLFRASKKRDEHCLVIYLNKDKSDVEAIGDNIWIKAAVENEDLFAHLNAALITAADDREPLQALGHKKFPKKYPKLFACPGSKKWKGVRIRSQLSQYLSFHGFGHNMPRRNGQDDPPMGWPTLVDWTQFKGPSKGCSFSLCTEIIMQLIEAQELNPIDWYLKPEEGDMSEDESGTNDETDVEEEVSTSTKKNKVVAVSTNVVEHITKVQELEERNNSVFKRRRRNIEELQAGLDALEDGELSENDAV